MCQARGSSLRPEAPPWQPAPAPEAAPARARGRGRGARKGRQPRPRSAAPRRDAPTPRASVETPTDLGAPIDAPTWPCPLCTFANSCDVFTCAMCNVGTYGGRVCADVGGSDDAAASGGGASGARPGRRGRDGTHLLNFSVAHEAPPDDIPPRRTRPPHAARAGSAARSAAHLDRSATREPPAARRQRFMLANFQFILGGSEPAGPRGAVDPDAPIEWDRVRAVRLVTSEEVRCPICLCVNQLVAPQVAPCGHPTCLPCALRATAHAAAAQKSNAHGNTANNDDAGCRCPICSEEFGVGDLRPAMIVHADPIRVGGRISLCRPGAASASYASLRRPGPAASTCIHVADLRGLHDAEIDEIRRARAEIESLGEDARVADDEHVFLDHAEEVIGRRRREWDAEHASPIEPADDPAEKIAEKSDGDPADGPPLQSADGQLIFVGPFSGRVLLAQFDTWTACPERFETEVLELSWHAQSDATRRRFRNLAHLPLGARFGVAEIDVAEVVSEEVLGEFGAEIAKRAERRRAAAKAEAKAEEARARDERERRRRTGRSSLAEELESVALSPQARHELEARRRQQQEYRRIEVPVAPEWRESWEAHEQRNAAKHAASFATITHKGFAAPCGPGLRSPGTSAERSPQPSPLSPGAKSSPSPHGAWAAGPSSSVRHGSAPPLALPPAASPRAADGPRPAATNAAPPRGAWRAGPSSHILG